MVSKILLFAFKGLFFHEDINSLYIRAVVKDGKNFNRMEQAACYGAQA